MGSSGKLEIEVELKSSADKVWGFVRDSTVLFPKALPHDYKNIEVLEGDGKAVGSIRLITYGEGTYFSSYEQFSYQVDLIVSTSRL